MKLQIIFISIIAILCSKITTAQNYVDLGLSVLWADRNASDFRDYFEHYNIEYSFPGETLPDKDEFEELINKCTWEWTVNGYKITGPNGNHIFLPAAGLKDDYYGTEYVGEYGFYWSSTGEYGSSSDPNVRESFHYLFFSRENIKVTTNHESNRYSVRFIKRKRKIEGDTFDEDLIYSSSVERMPQFPGGDTELLKFIYGNLKYPENTDGENVVRVVVQFYIDKLGYVRSPQILRATSPAFDEEALRVVRLLPKFIPGEHNGKKINVTYALPIIFNYTKNEPVL